MLLKGALRGNCVSHGNVGDVHMDLCVAAASAVQWRRCQPAGAHGRAPIVLKRTAVWRQGLADISEKLKTVLHFEAAVPK